MSPRRDRLGPVFEALADPTRRAVIARLSRGPASATELARTLPVTRQAVSKHLDSLRTAGLVAAERAGRTKRYRLTPAPFADAMGWMVSVGAAWDQRLRALRRHVERRQSSG